MIVDPRTLFGWQLELVTANLLSLFYGFKLFLRDSRLISLELSFIHDSDVSIKRVQHLLLQGLKGLLQPESRENLAGGGGGGYVL